MAEQTTIKADQIEGLSELIQAQVQEVLRQEARPDLQDVEEVRRSPAGILIRLEEQVKALKSEMDQRFDALKLEMDQRFVALAAKMDQRFDGLERRFTLLQWVVILNTFLLIALVGKFFLMK